MFSSLETFDHNEELSNWLFDIKGDSSIVKSGERGSLAFHNIGHFVCKWANTHQRCNGWAVGWAHIQPIINLSLYTYNQHDSEKWICLNN